MASRSVCASTRMLRSVINANCVRGSLMGVVSARRLISVICVMQGCSGTRRPRLMASVCVRMGIPRMIRRCVSCVPCLDVQIVRCKMFVVSVIPRFIEFRRQLMASVCARPLTLRIL